MKKNRKQRVEKQEVRYYSVRERLKKENVNLAQQFNRKNDFTNLMSDINGNL